MCRSQHDADVRAHRERQEIARGVRELRRSLLQQEIPSPPSEEDRPPTPVLDRFANWQQQDYYTQLFGASSSSTQAGQPDAFTAAYQDVAGSQLGASSSGPQVDAPSDLPQSSQQLGQQGDQFQPQPQPQSQQDPRQSSVEEFADQLFSCPVPGMTSSALTSYSSSTMSSHLTPSFYTGPAGHWYSQQDYGPDDQ